MSWWQVTALLAVIALLLEYKDRQTDAVRREQIQDKNEQIRILNHMVFEMNGSELREPVRRRRREPLISEEQYEQLQKTGRTKGRYESGRNEE